MWQRFGLISMVILWVSLVSLPTTLAQDGNQPTPDMGLIYTFDAQVFFPVVLEFHVNLSTLPETVIRGELTLVQASGYRQTFPLAEAEIGSADLDTTNIRKVIQFSAADAPRPFEPIDYRWEFTIQGEAEPSTVANQILFQPAGLNWQQAGAPPLMFWWYNERLGIGILADELAPTYRLLAAHTGGNQPEFQFVLFERDYEFCQSFTDVATGQNRQVVVGQPDIPCSVADLQAFLATYGYSLITADPNGLESRQSAIIKTLVEVFYGDFWSQPNLIPAWFMNGLTQLYQQGNNLRAIAALRNATLLNQLPDAETFQEPLRENADVNQQELWSARNYAFLLYLAERFGASTPFDIAQALAETPNVIEAIETTTGESFDDLYQNWRTWIDSPQAEIAAAWNPYLPNTPTPTLTATASQIPPSWTPTATATITLTPTSTSLVDRVRTIVPTATVLATLNLATPSNTPLPAGSLRTPTAIPTQVPAPQNDSENNLPCGGSAVLLPVAGLIWFSYQKRRTTV